MDIERYARISDLLAKHASRSYMKNHTGKIKKQQSKHRIKIIDNKSIKPISDISNIINIVQNDLNINSDNDDKLLNEINDTIDDTIDDNGDLMSYVFNSNDLEKKLHSLNAKLSVKLTNLRLIKKFIGLENKLKSNSLFLINIKNNNTIPLLFKINLQEIKKPNYIPLYTLKDYYILKQQISTYQQTIDRYHHSIEILNVSDESELDINKELSYDDVVNIFSHN